MHRVPVATAKTPIVAFLRKFKDAKIWNPQASRYLRGNAHVEAKSVVRKCANDRGVFVTNGAMHSFLSIIVNV